MAYIKVLKEMCKLCNRKAATREVIDRWNGSCGKFCTLCAKIKLQQVLDNENTAKRV